MNSAINFIARRSLIAACLAASAVGLLALVVQVAAVQPLPKVTEGGLANARRIGLRIEATFPDIRDCANARAGKEHGPGKCYGTWSAHDWQPILEFYEVTAAGEIAAVEAVAATAITSIPGVRAVTLRFYREEIWHTTPAGGGRRGEEVLLKDVTLRVPQPG